MDDDTNLLRATGEGDQQAFRQLVTRHTSTVRAIALRFTGNGADADEITQDVFLKIWAHARSFDAARADFTTWLYKITANRCFDTLRKRKRWAWLGFDAVPEQPSNAPAADEALAHRETLDAVRVDLLALPDRQRMALLLVVTGERTAQDVADVLEISRGAAEQLIVRARQTLRDKQQIRGGLRS